MKWQKNCVNDAINMKIKSYIFEEENLAGS